MKNNCVWNVHGQPEWIFNFKPQTWFTWSSLLIIFSLTSGNSSFKRERKIGRSCSIVASCNHHKNILKARRCIHPLFKSWITFTWKQFQEFRNRSKDCSHRRIEYENMETRESLSEKMETKILKKTCHSTYLIHAQKRSTEISNKYLLALISHFLG